MVFIDVSLACPWLFLFFCFTCPDDTTNSAGSFEMVENFDQDGLKKKDLFDQDVGLDAKKESYDGELHYTHNYIPDMADVII